MADPYYRYAAAAERDPRATFSDHISSDGSILTSQQMWDGGSLRASADFATNDNILPMRPGDYGLATSAISARGFTPIEDPALLRRDVPLAVKPEIVDYARSDPLRKPEILTGDESNLLFVDGLPKDCTRREVGHLFRPFIGFKEIRVVHKEARKSGEKAYVLCFVEFSDPNCALTAMDALQGYKFDDKKPDSPILKIQFAKFPFQRASHGLAR